jgi:hypothetical protein
MKLVIRILNKREVYSVVNEMCSREWVTELKICSKSKIVKRKEMSFQKWTWRILTSYVAEVRKISGNN